ncbi:carbohydrate-binding module family 50 protein [Polyporus arcularius HHB13444]|uniref:Carbohydrate-binding module family 50 protein n=1 Tax=Polyporus arcularius HHB13444 TaxID=1314778 RepID=A0A5C3PS45_9APHY|nr:carbohydrate-binding module family 50 protein [Polyporus arcularius HHB13444]
MVLSICPRAMMAYALLPILLLSRVGLVAAQSQATFAVFADASDIYPLPSSSSCADALASAVQCPNTILFAVPSSAAPISNLTAADLNTLCSATCYNSLVSTAAKVDAACPGWPYILGDTSYVASFPFQYLAYIWNLSCITQGSDYCVNIAQSSPSTSDTSITDEPPAQLCQNCTLDALNVQMSSPFGWDASFVSDWMTVQSTCGKSFNNTILAGLLFNSDSPSATNGTSYNVTASPTLTPASADSCVYGTYTVKSGDTCTSIASANSLSYDQLIAINGLDMPCTKLPAAGGKICLSGSCPLYTVKSSDTCVGIYQANGILWSQLLAWNPQINSYCTNIDTQVGKGICVGPPGGGYQPSTTLPPISGTPTALAIPTGPIAPGSDRSICGMWYEAVTGDTCPQILQIFQITNDTFYALNPNVNSDCSNLLAGFEYCVAVFGNTTSTSAFTVTTTGASLISVVDGDFPVGTGSIIASGNMTVTPVTASPQQSYPSTAPPAPTIAPGTVGEDSCLQYYTVQPGDTCLAIETVFSLRDEEFRAWNPEIDANCANIQVGLSYCVFGPYVSYTPTITLPPTTSPSGPTTTTTTTTSAAPAPTNVANGTITEGCTTYYTIKSGDTCTVIETMFSISLSDFRTWNPEVYVHSFRTNIVLGLAYCVSGPPPTSSPIAPGTITTGCDTYYTVKSGDTCAVMEDQFGITFDQIREWNIEIDSNCANIQPGLGYCVAGPAIGTGTLTPSQGCTAYYAVQRGDSCPAIESQFSITFTQIQAWNPEINSACSNIVAGVLYCVAGPASGPTTTTTTTSAAAPTGSGTLTPGQGCKAYYTVASGDNCGVIDTKFGITLAQFIKWNPEINSQCTNLQLGVQYCVSGP